MDAQRKAKLEAAAVLLRCHSYGPDGARRRTTWHPDHEGLDIEGRLERKASEAGAELRDYLESRAFRMALDTLLPGWIDIDYSDYARGSGTFVSDDPVEWYDFMVSNGVRADAAKLLLRDNGHPLDEGASRGSR